MVGLSCRGRYTFAYVFFIFIFSYKIPTVVGEEEIVYTDDHVFDGGDEAGDGVDFDGTEHDFELHRLDGGTVGDVLDIVLDDVKYQMKTLSLEPLLFEIPNFLSSEDCQHYIDLAQKEGLVSSTGNEGMSRQRRFMVLDKDMDKKINISEMIDTIGEAMDVSLEEADVLKMYEETNIDTDHDGIIDEDELQVFKPSQMKLYMNELIEKHPEKHSRYSEDVWLFSDNRQDSAFEWLQNRVSELVQLPIELIRTSLFQVVKYGVNGHYNAHWDSMMTNRKFPCCVREKTDRCRICRFMTIMFYLNDVEEGGETAFPAVGNEAVTMMSLQDQKYKNLYRSCDRFELTVKPEKGKALIWYNHFVDPDSGWLGNIDAQTYHGGCNVKKGEKWIANFWVKVTDDKEADIYNMLNTLPRDEL